MDITLKKKKGLGFICFLSWGQLLLLSPLWNLEQGAKGKLLKGERLPL